MDVRVGQKSKLSAEELMLLNCGVGEDFQESLGLQGDQPVHPKGNQSWLFIGRTDAEAETPILWPPDVKNWLIWKDLDAGKIEGRRRRGWQGMTSLTQWTWVWASFRRWSRTGKHGVLQSMGSQSQTQLSNWTTSTNSRAVTPWGLLLRAPSLTALTPPYSNVLFMSLSYELLEGGEY